jgi:pyruvate formate lyase activating enzyme
MELICEVCPRRCRLDEGKTGFCGIRGNVDGKNTDLFYGLLDLKRHAVFQAGIDGSETLVTLPGCNMQCYYCAWKITWAKIAKEDLEAVSIDRLVDFNGRRSFVWFGGEPSLHYEYILDAAPKLRAAGIKTELRTNGFIEPWVARKLGKAVDYVTVGVKASASATIYGRMTVDPEDVLSGLKVFYDENPRTSITNLVGPELNTMSDDRYFGEWVSTNLNPSMEVGLSALSVSGGHDNIQLEARTRHKLFAGIPEHLFLTMIRLWQAGLRNIHFHNLPELNPLIPYFASIYGKRYRYPRIP